jgi:hypothetical protein
MDISMMATDNIVLTGAGKTKAMDLIDFTSTIMEVLDPENTIESFQGFQDKQLFKVKLDNVLMCSLDNNTTIMGMGISHF